MVIRRRLAGAACAVAAFAAPGAAQSPLTTWFRQNNFGAPGGAVLFDAHAQLDLSIARLDCNFIQPPGVTGSVEFWVTPLEIWSAAANATLWTRLGTAVVAATAGVDLPSPAVFPQPIRLQAGPHGVALVCSSSLSHAYTGGTAPSGNFSTMEMWMTYGSAQNVPFTAPSFTPRTWNGSIHYTLEPPPTTQIFGWGCGIAYRPMIGSSGPPVGGTAMLLTTMRIPAGTALGAVCLAFQQANPAISLAAFGVPQCVLYTSPIDAALLYTVSGNTGAAPLAIPAGFSGVAVHAQSLLFAPSGVLATDGLTLSL